LRLLDFFLRHLRKSASICGSPVSSLPLAP
jgi:hypothetical protein